MKKTEPMKVIVKIEKETVNRGIKLFLVSRNNKGYFAHEVGKPTQWMEVTGKEEYKAHQLNPTVRRGNQYGRFFRQKPFTTIDQAIKTIEESAIQNVQYF
jgi:hypothetical protein